MPSLHLKHGIGPFIRCFYTQERNSVLAQASMGANSCECSPRCLPGLHNPAFHLAQGEAVSPESGQHSSRKSTPLTSTAWGILSFDLILSDAQPSVMLITLHAGSQNKAADAAQ